MAEKLGNAVLDLTADASGMDKGLSQGESKATSKMEQIGRAMVPIAKAAGVAAGAALVAGAVIGIEREALGDKLAAQLDLSEEESALAGQIAGKVYTDAYGDSFGQVNDAIGAVVGTLTDDLADPAAVEDLTKKALDLASAFDLDVTEAVSRAGVLMNTGLAKDADHAMDLITASMQQVAPGLRDELGEATVEYSKFFADLGFSGEEMFAALASADDKFALDKTGDAIKELSIRATDGSVLTTEAFEAMGLDAGAMSDAILAGGDTAREAFDLIVDGLGNIDNPSEQAQTAIALFGTPIEDLSAAQIPEFLDSLGNMGGGLGDVEGAANRLGDTLNENAQTRITDYKRSIEGMLARVVEAPGIIGQAAGAAAGFGQVLAPMAPMISGVAIVFQKQLSTVGTHFVSLGKTAGKTALSIAKTGASIIASVAKATARVVASIATQIARWAVLGVQSLLHAAKVALAWLIAMGPIALVIAAVIGLVALIIANWDKIVRVTKALWQKVTAFFGRLRDSVVAAARNLKERVLAFIQGMRDSVVSKVQSLVEWFKGLPGRILGAIGNLGRLLFDAGKQIVQGLIDGVSKMAGSLIKKAKDLISKITNLWPFSPAKEGPLRDMPPEKAGANIARLLGEGLTSGIPDVQASMSHAIAMPSFGTGFRFAGAEPLRVVLSVDGRELAESLGPPLVEEVRARTGL